MTLRTSVRYGAYAHSDTIEQIDTIAKDASVARATLLEVLVAGIKHPDSPITADTLAKTLELGKEALGMQKKAASKERQRLIETLKSIPTEDLAKLVSTVKPAEG